MDNLLQSTLTAQSKLEEFNDQVRLVINSIDQEFELLSMDDKTKFEKSEFGTIRRAVDSFATNTIPHLSEHLQQREQFLKLYLFDSN